MRFGGHPEPTVGCEWELQLVHADGFALADGILAIMGELGDNALIKPEYLQCCVELNTPPCGDAAGIERSLNEVLGHVASKAEPLGLRLAAAGTHPFDKKRGIVTPSERYLRMDGVHGMMPVAPVTFATHVHVACADGEAAIRAMRLLTPALPLLLAVGANSPYWHGLDTRYACFRQRLLAANPTYGVPPYFSCWGDYERLVRAAMRSMTIAGFRDLHWDIRPHADFGTLEVRVFDAQIDARRNAEIAALVRSLVVLATGTDEPLAGLPGPLPHWIELENHFRACKFGLDATLITTPEGALEAIEPMIRRLLALAAPVAERLGDGPHLETLAQGLRANSGATRQQAIGARHHSAEEVAEFLVEAIRPS